MPGPSQGGRLGGTRSEGLTADRRVVFGRLRDPPIHVERNGCEAAPHRTTRRCAFEQKARHGVAA
jgi:hypothetical protein